MRDAVAEKAALRKAILEQLRAMISDEHSARSTKICDRIMASEAWRKSERVLLFSPMRSEPDIATLHAMAVALAKQVAVVPSSARVEEELELPFVPDLVLVPGLAFSDAGRRLGRGGGFYDRLLAGRAKDAVKIGVCFEFQLREQLPHERHDALVDVVISG